jgi:hypothetical protein
MANNYVIGRGKLYFDQFLTGTQTPTGERYLGNTPALSLSSGYQNLDHYSSDEGLRVKDDSVQLQVDRTGSFQCDHISMDNVALMFGTEAATSNQAADTGRSETFTVQKGRVYQLGADDTNPQGVINVTNVVVTNNSGLHATGFITVGAQPVDTETVTVNGQAITFVVASPALHEVLIGPNTVATAQALKAEINAYPTLYDVDASGDANVVNLVAIASGVGGNAITLAEAVLAAGFTVSGATLTGGSASGVIVATGNFEVDTARGRVTLEEEPADIADDDVLEVVYDVLVGERIIVVDDENQVEGRLRFIADNPRGTNKDYFWPRVKLTPAGEFALKGETWQTMTFNMEILQPAQAGWKRVYITEQTA